MSAQNISQDEFENFNPARNPMMLEIAEEKHWFRDSDGDVIGVLLLDKADQDWNAVILGRDERGDFRAIKVEASIADETEAIETTCRLIEEYERSGQKVFPQGD